MALNRRHALALIGASLGVDQAFAQDVRRIEAEAVAAYLNATVPRDGSAQTLIIASRTAFIDQVFVGPESAKEAVLKVIPVATSRVVDDFIKRNSIRSKTSSLAGLLRADIQWQLVQQATIDGYFSSPSPSDGWAKFRAAHPNSTLMQLSRVGIDEKSGQALFCCTFVAGRLGGSGWAVLVQKALSSWQVIAAERVWIS